MSVRSIYEIITMGIKSVWKEHHHIPCRGRSNKSIVSMNNLATAVLLAWFPHAELWTRLNCIAHHFSLVFLGVKFLSLHICQRHSKVEWIFKSLLIAVNCGFMANIVVFQYVSVFQNAGKLIGTMWLHFSL